RLLLEIQLRGKTVDRKALNELHHDRWWVCFIENGKNGDDRRVAESGGVTRFIEYTFAHLGVGALAEDFNCDAPIQFLVVRFINNAQSSLTEFTLNAKAGKFGRWIFE